jgi:hypothetical protein
MTTGCPSSAVYGQLGYTVHTLVRARRQSFVASEVLHRLESERGRAEQLGEKDNVILYTRANATTDHHLHHASSESIISTSTYACAHMYCSHCRSASQGGSIHGPAAAQRNERPAAPRQHHGLLAVLAARSVQGQLAHSAVHGYPSGPGEFMHARAHWAWL